MQIILDKRPKNPTIIQGFPGIGLVGTIATEFLLEHLKTEQIGRINIEDLPPAVAIHNNKIVDPFGIFYNKQYNLVIVHAIAPTQGFEWTMASIIIELARKVQAKEIISMEGVAGPESTISKNYFYARKKIHKDRFTKLKVTPMNEGIIMGVTGALLLKAHKLPISCIFAETHSNLPDSKAAASIIEVLDKYLTLKVDYAPLLKQAETFEAKLQDLMKKSAQTQELSEKKRMNYVG